MAKILFESYGTGERVLKLLKSRKDYGGPQSVEDVCINLSMTNRNARSILSRMFQKGKIERIDKGVYRAKGDDREYDQSKPHYTEE
jgi:predicted transcriptional regulator of viral defense system